MRPGWLQTAAIRKREQIGELERVPAMAGMIHFNIGRLPLRQSRRGDLPDANGNSCREAGTKRPPNLATMPVHFCNILQTLDIF